ncbi:hypothetical protein [Nocardia yunnanensis]|uniref:hypothetical protein n=1 Tax=Nocardia yunnanensis TaxID=2382165 RepID=UPI0013C45FDD|nr:hypothetical protein [Nocardia yunnanensis]
MRKLDMSLCEVTHRDCTSDPIGFGHADEAYAVLRLHAAHGPQCRRFLAAHAYVSAETQDD